MTQYGGKQIITSAFLTKTSGPFSVRRTWRERLFSWPWKPFKATKTITIQVPSDEVLVMADRIIMHPEMFRRLQDKLDNITTPL